MEPPLQQPPAPPFGPATGPERSADDDAHRAPERRRQRQEKPQAVDAERADGITDGVAEERIFIFRCANGLAGLRIGGGEDERTMHRQRQRIGEEEGDRQHMRGIVVEVQVLVSRV